MGAYKRFQIISATALSLCTFNFLFGVKRIGESEFDPIVSSNSYILYSKVKKIDDESFFVYFSTETQTYKLGYKIADEGEWIMDKESKYMMKVPRHNQAFDTYNNHKFTILNKSFVEGTPLINLSTFESIKKLKTDDSVFSIKRINQTDYLK